MSSGKSKRRFFERNASPVVASDEDFDAVFAPMTAVGASIAQDIPIERIRANPYQARIKFNDIEPLAASMRTHGFTSRLRVRRDPAQPQLFQLVYGERRLRAAQSAGIAVIPCDVADYSDVQMREIGLTENVQRSDLEPLEEARAFREAIDRGGYSIRTLAAQIGKSKGYVQSRLDMLRAPDDVLDMVDQHPETFTAGLLLSQLPTVELRRPLIKRVIAGEIDKQTIRGIVRNVVAAAGVPVQAPASQPLAPNAHAESQHGAQALTPQSPKTLEAASAAAQQTLRPASTTERNRAERYSTRALGRATQTLEAMMAQLYQILPELQANERAQLRDVLLERHIPAVEQVVRDLDEPRQ